MFFFLHNKKRLPEAASILSLSFRLYKLGTLAFLISLLYVSEWISLLLWSFTPILFLLIPESILSVSKWFTPISRCLTIRISSIDWLRFVSFVSYIKQRDLPTYQLHLAIRLLSLLIEIAITVRSNDDCSSL